MEHCIRPRELAKQAGVKPQMIYNYIAAGRIEAEPCGDHDGTLCIEQDVAQAWLDAREAKARAKYEQIQRELRGEV